jgi:small conductance mechanosensitive channel
MMDTNTVSQLKISPELMDTAKSALFDFSLKLIGAIAVLIIGMWIAKRVKNLIIKVFERRKADPVLVSFTTSLLHVVLKIVVIMAALDTLDINTTSLIAMLGAAGLAVGLALQGSLSNFAAGVLIIIFKPFRLGHVVTVNGVAGKVKEISILTTTIDTFDNEKMIVPNAKVMADNITNHTAYSHRRIDLRASISYGDDIDRAREAIKNAVAEIPHVLDDPALEIILIEMADSSVNFAVRPWCHPDHYFEVKFGALEAIKKRFDAEGITIPFPQRDVHLYEHKESS